jgi:hypothetical protein
VRSTPPKIESRRFKMKKTTLSVFTAITFLLFLPASVVQFLGGQVYAQTVKETTYVKSGGHTIVVRTMAPAEVVKIEPYIDAKKGKEVGRLNLNVTIKNTANDAQSYRLFGQGKTENGGWLGGVGKAPGKGKLKPGQQGVAKIRTRYEGKSVPEHIRLDVFSPQ